MNKLKRLRKSGSKKSLIKKYNVPSQIITSSLSKKNNKIYSHHDDDDIDDLHAKVMMIIERVNDDCLGEIFMYVPACERPKIALVCKKWKRVLEYSWFNVKKLELTHWQYDEYPHFLKRKYPTIDGQFTFLKSLLYKCGRYLTELDLSVYAHCNILPVISEYCQNLVKLRIRIGNIDDAILDNAFSHLSKLKVLKIILHRCFRKANPAVPTTLINSLLNVADTLTDLNISNWPALLLQMAHFPEEMTSVISQLKALRKLGMAGIQCPKSMCDCLENSKTIKTNSDHACYVKSNIDVRALLNRIEELDIRGWNISDDCIFTIANTMKRLHTLVVSCDSLTDTSIVTCTKINNLKYLEFDGFNDAIDSSIKLLKNLTHLKLPFNNKITDELAIKVLENSPGMICYCVRNTVTLDHDQTEYEYLDIEYMKKQEHPRTNIR
ncbi:uncharacterized protein LOC122856531 [Aphidius gifuensis]|uniref:uncharacterized protein LOC122856531 n=1 Tax=Aphidius gifuensis TaxID=684658 RepID=UPI001CDB792C|nr:uncharacterized protein LOC122856531 [Aphidius gifuensis]